MAATEPILATLEQHSRRSKTRDKFVENIKKQVNNGWGFIPLLGSGVSSASGIPMGIDFTNYMLNALFRCLKPNNYPIKQSDQSDITDPLYLKRLDLSSDGWPASPLDEQIPQIKWFVGIITILALREVSGYPHSDEPTCSSILKIAREDIKDSDEDGADGIDAIEAIKDYFGRSTNNENVSALISKTSNQSDDLITLITRNIEPKINIDCTVEATVKYNPKDIFELYCKIVDCKSIEDLKQRQKRHHKQLKELMGELQLSNSDILKKILDPINCALAVWNNWVLTLDFLSRLERSYGGGVHLSQRRFSVIDSFNRHISHNKKPNLNHIMLAHLTGPLRINTILTTNFDSLTEIAFSELDRQLELFYVSINGELPEFNQSLRK